MTEVAQTRIMYISKFGIGKNIENSHTFAQLRQKSTQHLYDYIGEIQGPWFFIDEEMSIGSLNAGYSKDILDDINKVVSLLKTRGFDRVIVIDLTRPEIGVPTVRVIVPSLEVYGSDRLRVGERLLKAI